MAVVVLRRGVWYGLVIVLSAIAVSASAISVRKLFASSESPDRPPGVLAFHADPDGDSTLYTMNADGTNVRLVTRLIAGSPFSKWSPNGRLLAFLSGSYGEGELHVVPATGRQARKIGRHTVRAFDWSPDGKQLAYESTDDVIWTIGLDRGSRPRRLAVGHSPVWSPNGFWLAYFRGRESRTDIFKVAVRTPRPVRLTNHPAADHSPQWSPDGSRIAFVSTRDRNSELYVVGSGGNALRRLTRDPAPDEFFAWAPDGRRLVHVSYRDGADPHSIGIGNAEVYTVEIESRQVRNLTQNRHWDGDPSFSPDGRWIVFTRRTDHGEVAVMRSDGSQQTVLKGAVDTRLNDCCAAWRPKT